MHRDHIVPPCLAEVNNLRLTRRMSMPLSHVLTPCKKVPLHGPPDLEYARIALSLLTAINARRGLPNTSRHSVQPSSYLHLAPIASQRPSTKCSNTPHSGIPDSRPRTRTGAIQSCWHPGNRSGI